VITVVTMADYSKT